MVKFARMLQQTGLQVWIDVDQMKGSTVEAMAQVYLEAFVGPVRLPFMQ